MIKYVNEYIICNSLDKQNKELKKQLERLQQDYNNLEYKYNGLLECKNDIYTKYQESIIKK
jgi:hypothetical protein